MEPWPFRLPQYCPDCRATTVFFKIEHSPTFHYECQGKFQKPCLGGGHKLYPKEGSCKPFQFVSTIPTTLP